MAWGSARRASATKRSASTGSPARVLVGRAGPGVEELIALLADRVLERRQKSMAILNRLAHADDPAAAKIQAVLLDQRARLPALAYECGRANGGKVAPRRFEVVFTLSRRPRPAAETGRRARCPAKRRRSTAVRLIARVASQTRSSSLATGANRDHHAKFARFPRVRSVSPRPRSRQPQTARPARRRWRSARSASKSGNLPSTRPALAL